MQEGSNEGGRVEKLERKPFEYQDGLKVAYDRVKKVGELRGMGADKKILLAMQAMYMERGLLEEV